MLTKYAAIVTNRPRLAALLLAAEELIVVVTLAVGCVAAMTLLSFGGLWVMVRLGVQPNDVDLPVLYENEIEHTILESLSVTLGCMAVVVILEALRRRQRDLR